MPADSPLNGTSHIPHELVWLFPEPTHLCFLDASHLRITLDASYLREDRLQILKPPATLGARHWNLGAVTPIINVQHYDHRMVFTLSLAAQSRSEV